MSFRHGCRACTTSKRLIATALPDFLLPWTQVVPSKPTCRASQHRCYAELAVKRLDIESSSAAGPSTLRRVPQLTSRPEASRRPTPKQQAPHLRTSGYRQSKSSTTAKSHREPNVLPKLSKLVIKGDTAYRHVGERGAQESSPAGGEASTLAHYGRDHSSIVHVRDRRRGSKIPNKSFVHHHLQQSAPPSPSQLLAHLRVRPDLLSSQSAKALARYAKRLGDSETEYEALSGLHQIQDKDLTPAERDRQHGRRRRRRSSFDSKARQSQSRFGVGTSGSHGRLEFHAGMDDPPGTDTRFRKNPLYKPFQPHPWAEATFRPMETLPRNSDVQDRLCHLHHRLLLASLNPLQSDIDGSTSSIQRNIPPWSYASPQHSFRPVQTPSLFKELTDINLAANKEGMLFSGINSAKLAVLHLFIIYANRLAPSGKSDLTVTSDRQFRYLHDRTQDPAIGPTLLSFLEISHPNTKPNRQTLQLLVTELLWGLSKPNPLEFFVPQPIQYPNIAAPTLSAEPGADTSEDKLEEQQRDTEEVMSDIQTMLRHFWSRWQIKPGPETYRKIADYGLKHDSPEFAELAWTGWWSEMARETSRSRRGEGDSPRWDHRGLHSRRWREILSHMEGKRWISRQKTSVIEPQVAQNSFPGSTKTNGRSPWVFRRSRHVVNGSDACSHQAKLTDNPRGRIDATGFGPLESTQIYSMTDKGGKDWYGFKDGVFMWTWEGKSIPE